MNIYHSHEIERIRREELLRRADQERLAQSIRSERTPFWKRLGIRFAIPRLRPVAIRPVSSTEAQTARATR